jgi:hypothetical protein
MMKKWFIIAVLVTAVLCTNVFAIIGPPTAGLKKGQWSGGFNYTYLDLNLDKTKAKWSEYDDGVLSGSGTEKVKFKDVITDLYYGNLGYGIADWCQVYVQLGISDVRAQIRGEDDFYDENWVNFKFDNDFAWGLGTRITFAKQDKVDWGVAVQMNWLNTHCDKSGASAWGDGGEPDEGSTGYETDKTKVDLTAYNLFVALGPTIDMGGWKLYGGPFYTYLSGEVKGRYTEVGVNDDVPYTYAMKGKGDIKSDDHFGGYVGAQFNVAQNCDFTTEVGVTGEGWAAGAGITWNF